MANYLSQLLLKPSNSIIKIKDENAQNSIINLNTNLQKEINNRKQADTTLQSSINTTNQTLDNEIVNRQSADNYLHNLVNPNKRVYMFVGDSYAEAHYSWESNVEGWHVYCKDYLHLTNEQFLSNCAGATGFCTTNKWYDMINDYVVPKGVEVTDIVIGGGYNDKDFSVNTIMTAIHNCATMIRTKYPMARVWLSFMGWSCDDAQWLGLMQAKSAYIQGAGANGWNYIANIDWLGHNYTDGVFYTTTGDTPFGSNFHPNNNGNKSIARAISTVLRGGQFEDFKILDSCDLTEYTFGSNTAKPSYEQLYTSCTNNIVSLFSKHSIEVSYATPITVNMEGTLIPVGKLTSGLLHGDANEQKIGETFVLIQNTGGSNLDGEKFDVILKSGVIFVRNRKLVNNQWLSIANVFRITLHEFELLGIDRTRI